MTIDQAYEFCKAIANKDRSGIITPDQFNIFAAVAQNDAINKRLLGMDKDQGMRDEMLPILKEKTLITSEKGVVEIPKDYLRFSAAFTSDAEVDLLTASQFGKRELSRLKGPADDFPIAKMDAVNFTVAPRKVHKINFTYVAKYNDPNWDYSFVNGSPYYNSTLEAAETGKVSQGFSLAQTAHNEICYRILQYMGVNLSHDTLLQYGLTREQTS